MKGFLIEIKNNLLDPKHCLTMGKSVWLYMWLLDAVTSVDEDGVGKTKYGAPIKFEDIVSDLGISMRTYREWVDILRDNGYVNTKRAPYGLIITLNKTHKYFNKKSDVQKSAHPDVQKMSRDVQKSAHVIKTKTKTKTTLPPEYLKAKQRVTKNIDRLEKEYPDIPHSSEVVRWIEKAAEKNWDIGKNTQTYMKLYRKWCDNFKQEYVPKKKESNFVMVAKIS